jgi:hypothetical protein
MDAIPQIMLYVIGTFLNFAEFTRLALTSKKMDAKMVEPRKMIAKREVMRLFSSDLQSFRMIIHSVSYELGAQDYSTPTLNDGFDWFSILKEGLTLQVNWPLKLREQLKSVSNVLHKPENNLPCFYRDIFSKLETTMQEHLFEELSSPWTSKIDKFWEQIDCDFDDFYELENIYVLYANFYQHDSDVIKISPKMSQIWLMHNALVSYIKFWCKIHKIWIKWTIDEERPLQFLYEYSVRWSAFSNSIWKLSNQLAQFEKAFNKSYSDTWPETSYRFRIYKLMTKIWGSEVNDEDMLLNLKDCLKSALNEHHQDLLQHIRDKSVRKDTTAMAAVLKKFFLAVVDTSINEKSVHFVSSTNIAFDKFYNKLETVLLQECGRFIKLAWEVGYKAKNLKLVISVFEDYSNTIKSILPPKSQKNFVKYKTEIIIKFIRFIVCNRLKQFASFDFKKIEAKWNASCDKALEHVFDSKDSVFINHFFKVVDEKKFDRVRFQKYWIIMSGNDGNLMKKFYDNTLMMYDRFLKALSVKDAKIKTNKSKMNIDLPTNSEEMTMLSLLTPIPGKYVENLVSEYLGEYQQRATRSLSNTDDVPVNHWWITKAFQKKAISRIDEISETGGEGDTQEDSESTSELVNEFSQIFKNNKQCWEERTKSMKKNIVSFSFQSANNDRRASM